MLLELEYVVAARVELLELQSDQPVHAGVSSSRHSAAWLTTGPMRAVRLPARRERLMSVRVGARASDAA